MATAEPKSTRKQVFDAVDAERRYQELKPKTEAERVTLPVAGELVVMQHAVYRAMLAYTNDPTGTKSLDVIREIVAGGIRCLETHGVIERIW